ncbi:MAG TPA: ABC transporter ATP-binding protein, partial [Anaerolineales bacterium]|nr:ABC transporter ATP-binding protein [Anaerolineales bacterium]
MHASGWSSYLRSTNEKPRVSWALLKRVMRYSNPYRWHILGMLVIILINTALGLLTPLIFRTLIDQTIPQGKVDQLFVLAGGLLLIPTASGLLNVIQRRLNSWVGEGVIFDLRVALYERLQRMSLRFFTNTKVGELMSRLNNDVVGAQNAISNTLVGIITNLIQGAAVLLVMLSLEWRLTLISVLILPVLIFAARSMGARLREIARQAMDANAQMNAMMNETLNISGALLVKLFGHAILEVERFQSRAAQVRQIGVKRAVTGASFFVLIGLVSSVGTALVYGLGGYMVIQEVFTIGTIVAFGAYLTSLYGALQGLANAPVEFATSVVSFERVFEVIDLPVEIEEAPDPIHLMEVNGDLRFENVSFYYQPGDQNLLSEVRRYGRMENVTTVLSGDQDLKEKPKAHSDELKQAGEDHKTEEQPYSQARELALDEITFHVKPGQLVALVGPSGAGKTTLTYLIPRLYDPSKGRILLDGVDLRQVSLESLSAQIGMVTQETHLFHDTIRTNLLYARLDASQEQLKNACKA